MVYELLSSKDCKIKFDKCFLIGTLFYVIVYFFFLLIFIESSKLLLNFFVDTNVGNK